MVKSILSSPQESVLEQALAAAALRHKVISNNVANVNTPGFKKSDVTFEDQLAEALSPSKMALTRTNERHLTGGVGGDAAAQIVTEGDTSLRVDGNNVDIDVEMAKMAENNIYYDAIAQQLKIYYNNLQMAINGGKS